MKKFKRVVALVCVALMSLSLLAACGKKEEPSKTDNKTENTDNKTENKDDKGGSAASNDEIVELKWIAVGGGMPANYDAWKENIDKYLEEKIGVHINMEIVPWGDWDNRRSVIVSTNENYDILFTNNGTFNYDVSVGAFADITDLLQTNGSELYNFIPEDYWKACSIDGKIYGVPAYKDSSASMYFIWDKDKADQYGFDPSTMKTLADIEPGLQAIKDAEGTAPMIMIRSGLDKIYSKEYDNLGTGLPAVGVKYGGDAKVVSVFEQPEIVNDLKVLADYYQKGLINADAATLAENPTYRPIFIEQGWSGAAKTTWGPQNGANCVAYQWGNTVMSNDTVQGSMSCISASSKYQDKCIELLQLVNTDTKVRDALYFGLEGDNFDYVDAADGTKRVHKNNTDWTMAGYTQGTFFNLSMQDVEEFNQFEEVKELNGKAIASPAVGFHFDTANVADQVANCVEIWRKYQPELMTGAVPNGDVDGYVAQMLGEMKNAGFDDIMAEAQSQLDAQ